MKANKVSALRVKRGLHRANGAEPQVVGLTPPTTMNERKTDTMKTYILRNPKPVEPQKPIRPPRPKPAADSPARFASDADSPAARHVPRLCSGAKKFFFGFDSGIFCLDPAFHISASFRQRHRVLIFDIGLPVKSNCHPLVFWWCIGGAKGKRPSRPGSGVGKSPPENGGTNTMELVGR